MVVHDLNVTRIRIDPAETDSPLVIDPNAVLPLPATSESFQVIPRNHAQICERRCSMELVQFPLRHPRDSLMFPAELTPEDSFGLLVT
jgi:hypothetical protein